MSNKPWREGSAADRKQLKQWDESTANANATRKSLLAKIHIAKKDLHLDNDSYQALLFATTGYTSCKDCTTQQLKLIVKAFVDKGWKQPFKPLKAEAKNPKARAIFALWWELCELGVFKTKTRKACTQWASRYCKVDDINWMDNEQTTQLLNQLRKILRDFQSGDR